MNTDPIAQRKREWRSRLMRQWQSVEASQLVAWARSAAAHMLSLPEWQEARTIFLFLHMPRGELPTSELATAAIEAGKRVAAPVITGRGIMEAHAFEDLSQVTPGAFGIRAPDPSRHPLVPPSEIDLVVVPGLAFDRHGFRLGRGGGYYDRYLGRLSTATVKVGWTAQPFLFDRLPIHPHDVPVDVIVTDQEVHRVCLGG